MASFAATAQQFFERQLFARRPSLVLLFLLVTLALGWQAAGLRLHAGYEGLLPQDHRYVQAMQRHQEDLGAPATRLRIAFENTEGDVLDPRYLAQLRELGKELYFVRGIDRAALSSLWTGNTRRIDAGGTGTQGGALIPEGWDGSLASTAELRRNLQRAGEPGRLVANDFRSSLVEVPVLDRDPLSAEPLDYLEFGRALEQGIRARFEQGPFRVHIAGFAKARADLLGARREVLGFALLALALGAALLFVHTRCLAATLAPVLTSLFAVCWQLGLLRALGYGLDAGAMLVPCVVFALGITHAAQLIDAIGAETLAGRARLPAARHAVGALFVPGTAALGAAAAAFLALHLAGFGAMRDFAIAAALGVAALVPANLVLLPVLMSYSGICLRGRQRIEQRAQRTGLLWRLLAPAVTRSTATLTLTLALLLGVLGGIASLGLRIDEGEGAAAALRADSRYNRDRTFIDAHYAHGADTLVVLVETAPLTCYQYRNLERIDRFAWTMSNVRGVESVDSVAAVARRAARDANEGSLKWAALPREQRALDATFGQVPPQLVNNDCSLAPVTLGLADRGAHTLARVVDAVERFARENDDDQIRFTLAAGSAGVVAAANQQIVAVQPWILLLAHAGAGVLAFACFRSFAALVCIALPLALTSVLCAALMARLDIALRVATLPVLVLGVALGVDYLVYTFARLRALHWRGLALAEAWQQTLRSSGAAVGASALVLGCGFAAWVFSPLRIQAETGLLLGFMLLANMLGALWLLPALAHFFLQPATRETG